MHGITLQKSLATLYDCPCNMTTNTFICICVDHHSHIPELHEAKGKGDFFSRSKDSQSLLKSQMTPYDVAEVSYILYSMKRTKDAQFSRLGIYIEYRFVS